MVGRLGLSAGAGRGGDPARLPHHPGGRRLRRDDVRPGVPRRGLHGRGGDRASPPLLVAVRRPRGVGAGGVPRVSLLPPQRGRRRRRRARGGVAPAVVLLTGFALALALALAGGGRLGRLADLRLRAAWIFWAAIGLQLVA